MVKKAVVDFAAGGLHTAHLLADNAFNWRVFEANAQAYLRKQIAPDVFANICSAALSSPLTVPYGHTIYKYRCLALMELERYYEAFLDAQVMGGVFRDELSCRQMLCSIYLKRHNFSRALDCMSKLLSHAHIHNLDTTELAAQRSELLRFMARIKTFDALDFCRNLQQNPDKMQRDYCGRPINITGQAFFAINEERKLPLLVFDLTGPDNDTGFTHIYGQAAACEIPFLHGLTPGTTVTMLGYFMGAPHEQVIFSPCYLTD
jgi:hypothetical protein